MTRYIAKRLILLVFTLWAVSVLTFAMVNILPGDIAVILLGEFATPADLAAVRSRLGLDQPPLQRYLEWISGIFAGDFGTSMSFHKPIGPILADRLGNSLLLAALVLLIKIPLSMALGVSAALRTGSRYDSFVISGLMIIYSLPEFVLGLLLMLVFAIWYPILPGSSLLISGETALGKPLVLVLPILVLVLHQLSHLSQIVRASTIRTLESNFVRTAKLKGLPKWTVVARHVVPNSLPPIVADIGMNFGYLIGGLVVVETLFSYPGIGQLMVMAVETRDIPTIQIVVATVAMFYCVGNLLADIIALYINPRIRA